jgi:hypothetical protein
LHYSKIQVGIQSMIVLLRQVIMAIRKVVHLFWMLAIAALLIVNFAMQHHKMVYRIVAVTM